MYRSVSPILDLELTRVATGAGGHGAKEQLGENGSAVIKKEKTSNGLVVPEK